MRSNHLSLCFCCHSARLIHFGALIWPRRCLLRAPAKGGLLGCARRLHCRCCSTYDRPCAGKSLPHGMKEPCHFVLLSRARLCVQWSATTTAHCPTLARARSPAAAAGGVRPSRAAAGRWRPSPALSPRNSPRGCMEASVSRVHLQRFPWIHPANSDTAHAQL